MIFKAIVVSRTDDDNKIYITIPVLDGASSKTDFKGVNKRLATVCSLPGCMPVYATGDVVYVDFEQDNMSEPIVIGSLLSSESNTSIINVNAESLKVNVDTQLSDETFIGNELYNNIPVVSNDSQSGTGIDVLPVGNGGTGLDSVVPGYYLVGAGSQPLVQKQPSEVRTDIEAIKTVQYDNIVLSSSAWTAESSNNIPTGYYVQEYNLQGIRATYSTSPQVDCILSGTNATSDEAILTAFSYISLVETLTNKLRIKCIGQVPTVDIPLRLIVFI